MSDAKVACKDCRWMREDEYQYTCTSPALTRFDPVHGNIIGVVNCYSKNTNGYCPDFEAGQPMSKRFRELFLERAR